ncbi:MAG: BLUF domain-containing protein [Formivibrio sp.]|nr:BLUF domain-containing protein [Formivibrio sp.]
MLVRLLYASRAAQPLSTETVETILAQSRAHNPEHGVTGILCYSGDIFMQVLEGGRDAVCELYNNIARDERHLNVRLLSYEEISERRFANWTMGQVNLAKVNPSMMLKYAKTAELDPFNCSGQASMALLDDLIATGAVLGRAG